MHQNKCYCGYKLGYTTPCYYKCPKCLRKWFYDYVKGWILITDTTLTEKEYLYY